MDIQDLIITQSLEQFGYQQKYITGDLMIRENKNFNIFSTVNIENKDFAIWKYYYNDKMGVYQIHLIELK